MDHYCFYLKQNPLIALENLLLQEMYLGCVGTFQPELEHLEIQDKLHHDKNIENDK